VKIHPEQRDEIMRLAKCKLMMTLPEMLVAIRNICGADVVTLDQLTANQADLVIWSMQEEPTLNAMDEYNGEEYEAY